MVQGRLANPQRVLTTGQIARICNVAPRTVSKWFDLGQLRGYRIPGSRDRRVPVDQLVRFMKAHDMPLNGLDAGPRRILVVHPDPEMAATLVQRLNQIGYEASSAGSLFEAGLLAERTRPHAVLLDQDTDDQAADVASVLRRQLDLGDVKLLIAREHADAMRDESADGFDGVVSKPFTMADLAGVLNGLFQ